MAALTAALRALWGETDGGEGWRERGEKSATLFRTLNISAFHFLVLFHEVPPFLVLWSVSDSLPFHLNKIHAMPGLRLWVCGEGKPTWDAYGHVFVGVLTLWCALPWAHALWKVIHISLNYSDNNDSWDIRWLTCLSPRSQQPSVLPWTSLRENSNMPPFPFLVFFPPIYKTVHSYSQLLSQSHLSLLVYLFHVWCHYFFMTHSLLKSILRPKKYGVFQNSVSQSSPIFYSTSSMWLIHL